ncbi:hypothetical protein R1flu_017610 [Riccia fluitans]|uniref:Uncharacterized protein n=1 Tax=Riccia fluitans TaxID=41844 RepID=A0ABD1ZDN4_9MARC
MAKGAVSQCRVWLPQHLCLLPKGKRVLAMLGWISEGLDFLDLVIVAAVPTSDDCLADVARLQRTLDSAESKLPAALREEQKLCVIGEYRMFADEKSFSRARDGGSESKYLQDDQRISESLTSIHRADGAWALFVGHTCCGEGKNLNMVPNLYHIFQDDCNVAPLNTHIIIYNQPKLGSHYYSCSRWISAHKTSSVQASSQSKVQKPVWLSKVEERKSFQNIDMIMMKLNCSSFIDQKVQDDVATPTQSGRERAVHIANVYPRRIIAVLITVWATFLYCIARSLAPLLSISPTKVPFLGILIKKSMLLQMMQIRCRQLMAWPFMLLSGGLGPEQPNVADADRVAIPKHTTWFSLLIDKIVGAIVGCIVLNYHSRILSFLIDSGRNLTNDVLRTGCVWLMGVPAGFKINTELAAVFGTLSLHWIQTWSTLLFTSVPAIKVFLLVLGLSGIVMGFTVMSSLLADMASLSTIHVLTLHDAIGFIYSNQLRALAALFRLFRGRKHNVLRGRWDSFDCSVEQLLVGSLMFTPLLLLLPTTSVFYTFFSIIFMTISSVRLSIQYLVSIFLSFPFYEVATWFLHPKTFPSGVWLQMVHLKEPVVQISTNSKSPTFGEGYKKCESGTLSPLQKSESTAFDKEHESRGTSGTFASERSKEAKQGKVLLSALEIRTASFGELLKPFLVTHYSALQWPSPATLAYKIVSGERFSGKLHFGPHGTFAVAFRLVESYCLTLTGFVAFERVHFICLPCSREL